jgi:hypothetical protein
MALPINITYRIVDQDGDEIPTHLIKPGFDLPAKMRSVEVTEDGSEMVITIEYLHGKEVDA